MESLVYVATFLNDKSLAEPASRSVLAIIESAAETETPLTGPPVVVILKNARQYIRRESHRTQIDRHIARLTAEDVTGSGDIEDGFVALFNGRDLTGWTGNTTGYVAEDGKIVLHPTLGGGNLYSEKQFGDFELRFEFRLTPGANNGLGIRAPLKGDAAYQGMELQILDNSSFIYERLKPYQYHGSIYGVVPAKRGALNPVGEWNEERVIVRGKQVKVILNDITIVDADIDAASAGGTADGRDHPGLKREKGHIGFLGHGSYLEFRRIRIKEL
jgi:hypothetical protein